MERLHKQESYLTSVQFPCTEQAIIDLHALFISPGIHHVEIETISKGRMLLEALLVSLNCYTQMACITTHRTAFTINIYDCSYDLALQPCIETFFTESLFFDCMIVELSAALTSTAWYKNVEKYLYTSAISQQVPIIMVRYTTEG